MDTIPLRDAIRALREEILAARGEAANREVRFELGPIEMEFQVVARREGSGDAKFGFHIFGVEATLGGSGKIQNERTQKVKFVLNPVATGPTGETGKVAIARNNPTAQNPAKPTLERQ